MTDENILVCSSTPVMGFKEVRNCYKCGIKVYLVDNWADVKINKVICDNCMKIEYKKYKNPKIKVLDRTVENINEKLDMNFTKEQFKQFAKNMLEEKKFDEDIPFFLIFFTRNN